MNDFDYDIVQKKRVARGAFAHVNRKRGKWKVYRYATGEIDLVCPFCCALNAHEDLREFDLRDWHYCRRCGVWLGG